MSKLIVIFSTFILSISIYAVVGTDEEAIENLNPLCQILIFDQSENLKWSCSGTITKSNEITTAGHCVDKFQSLGLKPQIKCGYQGIDKEKVEYQKTDSGNLVMVNGQNFSEEAEVSQVFGPNSLTLPESDKAIIKLTKDLAIQPISVITEENKSQLYQPAEEGRPNLLKPGVKCIVAGFGIDSEKNGGILNSAELKGEIYAGSGSFISKGTIIFSSEINDKINSEIKCNVDFYLDKIGVFRNTDQKEFLKNMMKLFKYMGTHGLTNGSLLPGDSGGPILCREKEDSPWIQIGVNSKINALKFLDMGPNLEFKETPKYENYFHDLLNSPPLVEYK